MSKPPIAILTLHPNNLGGILSVMKIVYKFCEHYFEPTLFFLGFDKEISAHLSSIKLSSSVRYTEYFGMRSVEVGARWAFWEPGHYVNTLKEWDRVLKGYEYFFVVGGNPIPAHPLVKLNKKFVVWAATTSQAEKIYRHKKKQSLSRGIIDGFANVFMKRIENKILKKADFILSQSLYFNRLCKQSLGYERNRVKFCGYPRLLDRDCSGFKHNREKNIIAVGRFDDRRKNIGMLLRVFDKIYAKQPGAKLYVIGSRPSGSRISNFESLHSFQNVIFTGEVSTQDLENYYKSSSLMLITSYQEGLGIIGLEALSYGVPVIATDCGGVRDYIVSGKNGYLVDIDDDNSMSARAVEVLSDDLLFKKMTSMATRFVRDNYSYDKVYAGFKEGLSAIYPELKKHFNQID